MCDTTQLERLNQGPLSTAAVQAIFREIMSASISLQSDVTISYLGPRGTFSHEAAHERFGDSIEYQPQRTISDVFAAIERGESAYGIVPYENSTFGFVSLTLDRLVSSSVVVKAAHYLPVSHHLASRATDMRGIRRVYSHPEAFGQCSEFLTREMPQVERVDCDSTAQAADLAAQHDDTAAICSLKCAHIYHLNVLKQSVENNMGKHACGIH